MDGQHQNGVPKFGKMLAKQDLGKQPISGIQQFAGTSAIHRQQGRHAPISATP
jgi:hypothetical protein